MNLSGHQIVRKAGRVLLIVCMLCVAVPASAAVLATWNPAGTVDSTAPLPPASVASSVSAGNLTGSTGLTSPGPFANAYELDNWPSGALNLNDYLDFSVSGTGVTYSTVVFSLYNNFDGIGNWELRSSADGFAAALDAGTFSTISFSGQLITANVSSLGVRNGTIEFRLYTFNNSGDTNPLERGIRGTGGLGQGLVVNGSITTAVAAPAVSAPTLDSGRWLLLAGLLLIAWQTFRGQKNCNARE